MPDLMERLYCSEQIHIPPTFPYIMKLYCKAAIRTQPYDLLKWSAAYFRALANGEEPPVKERVEYPPYDSPSGLTPGYIKILINQLGKDPATTITAQTLFQKWNDICLDEHLLVKLIALLGANTTINFVNFVGVCAGFISKSLTQTMILLCELFTEEPEGGMATVPYGLFVDLYMFLAQMECGPLTEKEKKHQEDIMEEEDICEVAKKIRLGEYEGEFEGEAIYGEGPELMGEEEMKEEVEEEKIKEEELGETTSHSGEVLKEEVEEKEPEEHEVVAEEEGGDEEDEEEESLDEKYDDVSLGYSLRSFKEKEAESESSAPLGEKEESEEVSVKGEEVTEEWEQSVVEKEEEMEEPALAVPVEEEKPQPKKITLEDLEDSIRAKIEEKLAAESKSLMGEEDREFEDLSSYLLGAAKRVQKFTAETLGFKIFRRYMRQEVPGIGPSIDMEQVEKVINFMDYWGQKQELMVMPRNIRHWMCPPLDKIPTPEP